MLTFEEDEAVSGVYIRPGTYAFVPDPRTVADRDIILRVYVDAPGLGVAERRVVLRPWDATAEEL